MHVLIIGAGAIGTLVAAHLIQAGHPVTLAARPHTAAVLREQGLCLEVAGGQAAIGPVDVTTSLDEALEQGHSYDLAILAVKSYDTAQVADALRDANSGLPAVVTLQNGIGNEETLAGALGAERVMAGAITTPATLVAPGHVVVERPVTQVGVADLSPRPQVTSATVAGLLNESGFQARAYPHWQSLKWTKLIMNLLCNASCALLNWSPERVWGDPRLAELEIAAWQEAMAVLRHQGCRLVNLGGYPLAFLEPWLRQLPPSILRRPLGRFVVAGRGDKSPSLQIDLGKGKQRSEVDWLNGAVVGAGQAAGMIVPANRVLHRSLASVVRGKEPWSRYQDRPEVLLEQWRQEKLAGR